MTVKDVIIKTATVLGETDVVDGLESGQTLSDEVQKKVDLMLEGFNSVLREIALDYSPLKNKETFSGPVVNFSAFAYTPYKILDATDFKRQRDRRNSLRYVYKVFRAESNDRIFLYPHR